MKTCIIIPTYNEAKFIAGLIEKIRQNVQEAEIVVVDDGSCDDTYNIARNTGVTVLRNSNNEGKGASLIKGFEYALNNGFEAVITMDGDGQHLPQDLAYFMRLAKFSDSAILVGNRMLKPKNMPYHRRLTNKTMSWFISKIAKQKIYDTQCGLRLIKKSALEKLNLKTCKYETESEVLIQASRLGFKIESIPIRSVYSGEKSKINPLIDTLRFLRFMAREVFQRYP